MSPFVRKEGLEMIFIGALLLCLFFVLDTFIRLKLKSTGRKFVFLRGGTLDYSEYTKRRIEHGWPLWPVYLMWPSVILGIGFVVVGIFLRAASH
jgi:hypothetical protein